MEIMRKIIEIDEELCNGCGQCVIACAEGAIQIIDGKAKVISDNLCDGLGACIGDCPEDALKIIEREAVDFDEEAVEVHLAKQKKETGEPETMACGCPSSQIQEFPGASPCEAANKPSTVTSGESALSHWPVQIKLIPPTASFLKGADLLVTADCVPVAYPSYHSDFLKGKTVMVGCPKLDDAQEYIDKFAEIFKVADLKSITCLIMEVPCCSGLPMILKKAMEKSGIQMPIEEVVISARGKILP
jgi:NAD-dependent dihydropyrimidine dehydrogenase PreA subunit